MNVSQYHTVPRSELVGELCTITSAICAEYTDLATTISDHQQDYLQAYSTSPGSSVAAKNREAQYYTTDLTRQILERRAKINSLMLCRDLITFILLERVPGTVPFPELATFDNDSCTTA